MVPSRTVPSGTDIAALNPKKRGLALERMFTL
jgi:hypothetical protein